MEYVRKTVDVFRIEQKTFCGWEYIITEASLKAAEKQLKCYRENQPEYPVRIRKCREPKPVIIKVNKIYDLSIKFEIETKKGEYKLDRAYEFSTGRFTCVEIKEKFNEPKENTFVYKFRLSKWGDMTGLK